MAWNFIKNQQCYQCGRKREVVGAGSVLGPEAKEESPGFIAEAHDFPLPGAAAAEVYVEVTPGK